MANTTLKVSMDDLKTEAEEISKEIVNIEKNWQSLTELVEDSTSYWEGEASNQHRKILSDEKTTMENLIKKLKEHPKDLFDMAGVYIQAEKTAKKLANALPKDVII